MPSFEGRTINDLTYVENTAIPPLTLPEASGEDIPLVYAISPALPAGVSFNPVTRVLSGTPTAPLPRSTYTYTVTDEDGDTDRLTFTIEVVADAAPNFEGQTVDNLGFIENRTITPLTLPPASGGDIPLAYAISPALPAGLSFNAVTRVLSGTPTAPHPRSTYTYTATDGNGDTDRLTFTIVVTADPVPSFEGETVDDLSFVENVAITSLILPPASGGDIPLAYAISPALPAGLSFNTATRVLSGTPTAPHPRSTYTYTATDEDGDTDRLTFAIQITEGLVPTLEGETVDGVSFVENMPITPLTLPAADGGDAPLTYAISPALPEGLSFNPATRMLSGTPTALSPGTTYTYTYTVTDANGDTDELTFTVVTVGVPGSPRNLSATPGDQQVMLRWSAPASDGGSPITGYDYQVDAGSWIPTGSAETRHVVRDLVNGTTYTFRVRAVNAANEQSRSSDSESAPVSATPISATPTIGVEEKQAVEDTVQAVTAATTANITANIGTRFSATPTGGNVVVVGGRTLNVGSAPAPSALSSAFGPERDSSVTPSPVPGRWEFESDDLLGLSAFEFSLNAAEDGAGNGDSSPQWTVWGRGDLQSFESQPERGATYDGDLRAGYLGIDARLGDRWLVGLATSLARAEADYDTGDDSSGGGGVLGIRMRGVHPYLRYAPDAKSEFWTILGAGQGEIENERAADVTRETSDIKMWMGAAGARRSLVSVDGLGLALLGDVGFARVETDDGLQAIDGLTVDSWRARLGVEGSHTASLASGATLTSFVEVAGRYDGGDGDDEVGLEVSPGLYISDPSTRFGLEVRGRVLALHSAESYKEHGVSMTASLSPGSDGVGLSLSLSPRWGANTEGGADTLWRDDTFERLESGAAQHDAMSFDARVGYGVRAMSGLLTPFGEFSLWDQYSQQMRLGARFNRQHSGLGALSLELSGERRESPVNDPEHRVGVIGRLRF